MARFRYRMQSILDLKYKTEGQAKTEFGIAQRELNEEIAKLDELYARKEAYFQAGRSMRGSDALPVMEIMQNDAWLERMDDMIEQQIKQVQYAEQVVEEKRAILTVEVQERKMQERLREKAYEQFLMDEKAAEFKENDERSAFVYGQKEE
ncbi:MAG: flagellar export protein FliJ [Lachnospiraceae bacterium]|nr:flagellar export protein FliJ [Lachnospiraceae bacterium]